MNEDDQTVENSERARYVTDMVAMWIMNDGDYYFQAQENARSGASTLGVFLGDVLRTAATHKRYRGTAPWHVAQELAENDYDRIHWDDVADVLLAE